MAKRHSLRHCHRVLVAQMSINFHRQRTAVFVTKPAAHRRNINTGLDAKCREQMPQIVMRDFDHADLLARTRFSSACWQVRTAMTGWLAISSGRVLRKRTSNSIMSGIIGTRRIVQFLVPVSGSPRTVISFFSKSQSASR